MRQPKPATPEAILAAAESLARNVASLAVQVQRLANRIEPFDGTKDMSAWEAKRPPGTTAEAAMALLRHATAALDGCERDFATIKAKQEQNLNDAWSRADAKEHMR
jgi:hypothetical protein